jgi:hypothetical protein
LPARCGQHARDFDTQHEKTTPHQQQNDYSCQASSAKRSNNKQQQQQPTGTNLSRYFIWFEEFSATSPSKLELKIAMASTTTQRRKGGAPKSQDGVIQVANAMATPKSIENDMPVPVATVKRNKCGTSPFDKSWLNMDCCGLFCAGITYGLHAYGVYAVCLVLLPPWMSVTDAAGVRTMTIMGHFHRLAFTMVAVLAVFAHFKAMTTDPGAVPPDAVPLEPKPDIETPTNGESGEQDPMIQPQKKGKRLCRRCNAFKPKRAHHCSVCRRCIIKMDRKYYVVLSSFCE